MISQLSAVDSKAFWEEIKVRAQTVSRSGNVHVRCNATHDLIILT